MRVKLLPEDGDLYVYVESQARIGKERSMRRKRFKRYWARLKELQRQRPSYSTLLMKLGAAQKQVGRIAKLAGDIARKIAEGRVDKESLEFLTVKGRS